MNGPERTLLWRAVGAMVVPVAAVLLGRSVYVAAWWDTAVSLGWAAWFGVAVVAGLSVVEACWLGSLWALLGSKGRVSVALARLESAASIRSRRVRRMRAVAVVGSATLTLLLIEVAFRVLSIHPPPRPREKTLDTLAVDNTLNALGIREDWDAIADDDPRLRIVFLGDSMTFGDGVEQRDTFCHLIEAMLSPSLPDGALTINVSKSDTSPVHQIEIYRKLREALRPDVVVHVLYPNDLNGLTHNTLVDIHAIGDSDLWLSGRSYLFRYVEDQIRTRLAIRATINYFRGGRDPAQQDAAWEELEQAVRATKALVEADGATYCIVFHPWLFRLDDTPLAAEHVRMGALARALAVPYLDLLPAFEGLDARELRISEINEHANPRGHQIAARRIVQFLADKVLPLHEDRPVGE